MTRSSTNGSTPRRGFRFPWSSGEKPRDARIERATNLALEPLETRVLMAVDAPLQPNQFAAIKNGLDGLSNWADTLDNFGDFAKQLPLVGRSIGQSLDLGGTLRQTLLTPINNLSGPTPLQIAAEIQNALPGTTVTPTDSDPARPNEIRFDVTFNRTKSENRPLNFGANAEGINPDASFTAALTSGLAGNLSFGFDKTAGLSDSEAFFVRLAQNNGLVANASVSLTDANFGISIGAMGPDATGNNGARVVNGDLTLAAGLSASLVDQDADGKITLDELDSTTLGSIVSLARVHNGNDLSATLPVEAKLGTFTGGGTVTVTDADLLDATAPTVNMTSAALNKLKNLTPADAAALLQQVGPSLQSLAGSLTPKGGVPFVEDAISRIVNFTDQLNDFAGGLFDAVFDGASSYTGSAAARVGEDLTNDAVLKITLEDGDAATAPLTAQLNVAKESASDLASLVAEIQSEIAAAGLVTLVDAQATGDRIRIFATNDEHQLTIRFAGDDRGAKELGFTPTLSTAAFKFNSIQSLVQRLDELMPDLDAGGIDVDFDGTNLTFQLAFEKGFTKEVELDLTEEIPLGPAGSLALTGSVHADAHAHARLTLGLGYDLTNPGGKFFVLDGSAVEIEAEFHTHEPFSLTASLGMLELGVENGVANFSLSAGFELNDLTPGDGGLRSGDFLPKNDNGTPNDATDDTPIKDDNGTPDDPTDDQPASVGSPVFAASGAVVLPLKLSAGAEDMGITLPGNAPTITLNFQAGPPASVNADFTGLQALVDQFKNFSTDNVFGILKNLVGLIQNSDLPLFNEPLPLVGKSLKDLLNQVTGFADTLNNGLGGALGNVKDLKKLLLGDVAGQTLAGAEGLIGAVTGALANTPLLNSLNDAVQQGGEEAAHNLSHAVGALVDAARGIVETAGDGALAKLPGALVSALKAVDEAVTHVKAVAAALPDGAEPRESIELGLAEVEAVLRPIRKLVPSIERLSSFLFDALGLANLVDFATLENTVLPALQSTFDALAASAAKDATKAVIDSLRSALSLPAANGFATLAGPGDLDSFELLKGLSGLRKLIQDFGNGPLADNDPNNQNEPGDFARGALADLARSLPGQPEVELVGNDLNIGFDFTFNETIDDQALDFDLSVGPDLFPVEFVSQGTIDLGIGAGLELDFGVDLVGITSDPLAALFLRDSTKLRLTGLIESTDFAAGVSIGGVDAIQLGVGPDHFGTVTLKNDANDGPAEFGLRLKQVPGDKVPLKTFGLSAFELFEDGALSLSVPIKVDDAFVTIDGTDQTAIDPLTLSMSDLKDFDSLNFNLPDQLLTTLQRELLSLDFLFKGIKAFLDRISGGLLNDLIGKFPVIGDAIDLLESSLGKLLAPSTADGAPAALAAPGGQGVTSAVAPGEGFLDQLKTRLDTVIEEGKNDVAKLAEQAVEDVLKHIFFDLLGPGGIAILKLDANKHDAGADDVDDSAADWQDVDIDVVGNLNDFSETTVTAKLPLGSPVDVVHADFDLGFDGLGIVGFQTSGAVEITLDWSVDLAFELSKAGGFTLLLDSNPLNPGDTKEVEFEIVAGFTPGTKLNANLFFLALEAVDRGNTHLSGGAALDIVKAGGRLPVSEFGTAKFNPLLDADVIIDLALKTGFSTGAITPNANLPGLAADLFVDWGFNLGLDGFSTDSPTVELNDIRLDLGGFISKALGPIIDTIDDFLAPIRPLLDLLDTEIPVISQLAKLLQQPPITFLDAIGALGSGAQTVEKLVDILNAVDGIVSQARSLADPTPDDDTDNVFLRFGDIKFNSTDQIDRNGTGPVEQIKEKFADGFGEAFDNLSGATKDFINSLTGNGSSALAKGGMQSAAFGSFETAIGKFSIPLFESPSDIVGLLFGQDVNLVTWDVPRMEASFEFSQLFGPIIPPFPVFAKIGGGFGIFADLYLGMDTRGIRTGDFFNGIFFGDTEGAKAGAPELPELGVFLEFKAGAELSIPFAKAGVEGGIRADIFADWNDPDKNGKVHLDELAANFQRGLQCVFDLGGKFDAFISAYLNIEIPLGFTSITLVDVNFDIFRATIFDFSHTCPPLPPPVPATKSGSELLLNIGDRAEYRQNGATDGDDKIVVFGEADRDGDGLINSMTEDINGDGKISEDELRDLFPDGDNVFTLGSVAIIGYGVVQFEHGIQSIKGHGGAGKDAITIDASVSLPTTLTGGAGDDLIRGGGGADDIDGGEGTDELSGGLGNDVVRGGEGNDKVAGGAGEDQVFGDGGDDTVFGGNNDGDEGAATADTTADDDKKDTVDGGAGNDQLYGHLGNDILTGGQGADTLSGGAGDDLMSGNADNDLMFGDAGDDDVFGGSGDDQMKGGEGADELFGENNNDYVEGGAGDDVVDGGAGNDNLIGGSTDEAAGNIDGNDNIFGGTGDDLILGDNGRIGDVVSFTGGAGNDVINAGSGFDTVFGQGGNDTINAGANHDVVTAGDGNDTVHGDGGNDTVLGNAGADSIFGDAGDDTLEAGTENDFVYGGIGRDLVKGQEGNDYMEGNAGIDTLLGGTGHDSILGGSSGADDLAAGLDEGDSIVGAAGDDIILGDNGTIVGLEAHTLETGGAGSDTVYGGAGSDTIFGGGAADLLVGDSAIDSGNDIVVGDEGDKTATQVVARTSATGGNDSIFGSAGVDTLLGGVGDDEISGDAGNDIALGDNGRVLLGASGNERVETTDPGVGGNDTMVGGFGNDIMLGGAGSDTITGDLTANDDIPAGQTADDILLGDNGFIQLVAKPGQIRVITTSDPTQGASDTIVAGDGSDVVMGGTASETISAGEGRDLVFGDHGKLELDGTPNDNFFSIDTGAAQGGAGDTVTGDAGDDTVLGGQGADNLSGNDGDDDLIGGHNVAGGADAGDIMDGGTGNDVLAGDNARVIRRTDSASPLYRTLAGQTMYKLGADGFFTATYEPNVTDLARSIPGGTIGRDVYILDHSTTTTPEKYGNDDIAGGAGNDSVWGQLGDDRIQGDGAIGAINGQGESVDNAATDGDDYIEGNGGADLIYGNQGQDDIVGGSSRLFGLTTAVQRPDGADVIFGGSGTQTARNHAGDPSAANGHANDADMIVGDNGSIFRLVVLGGGGTTQYVTFNYDNYGGKRLIPRAVEMHDYSANDVATDDVGGADVIHGEAGDDSIHGMGFDDILYGDAQDDEVFGESGNDWMSGGTGIDGMLGDDGKLLTSRNGLTEPLYNINTATSPQTISTPGNIHVANINVAGTLSKAADLEPFDIPNATFGRDTMYGGWGDDKMHGGMNNDAMSGAEALDGFYNAPGLTPVLQFNATTGKFNVAGDPLAFVDSPSLAALRKIEGHMLNFSETEIDGSDAIFGDTGNDWLVGGRGTDRLYGGRGNDILNADDNLNTNGGANDVPDEGDFREGDIAFGGGGRDTLLANTGEDRLIDWTGEFNSYVVPFAPFGDRTVTRQILPGLVDFLLQLSEADGADQTRVAPGLGTAARNGEPFGELGMVLQKDSDWQDQTGGPVDDQAGNKPGGPKDRK